MGALGFEFRRRAFCTVHLRELIRQELTVRDALEKVCVDYAQGGMDERRKKKMLSFLWESFYELTLSCTANVSESPGFEKFFRDFVRSD